MAKIKKFDKPALRKFREDFEKAIASFAKRTGVAMKLGSASYNESSVTYKLEVCIADTASGMSSEEALGRKSLDLEGVFFGLTGDDYGRTWKSWDGQTYRLVGIKSSRPKYPVSGVNVITGKGFKFEEDIIKKLSKKLKK
jgi:hypothetical protein